MRWRRSSATARPAGAGGPCGGWPSAPPGPRAGSPSPRRLTAPRGAECRQEPPGRTARRAQRRRRRRRPAPSAVPTAPPRRPAGPRRRSPPLLDWLYTAISWVMKEWHALFSTFLDPAGGLSWALSIVFLVVTIRILLFRLFIRQVKSQRAMQEIQPEIQKLRQQYGSDRQGFSQAVMALQKERGVNPLAGCLPILPQIPVFISLFHVLRRIQPGAVGLYSWSTELTQQCAVAKLFGLAPISSSFVMQEPKQSAVLELTNGSYTPIRVVAMVLIVIMCVTTFFTQKQIMRRSGPVEGQAATVQ